MISVEEAYRLILEHVRKPQLTEMAIHNLSEEVLAESISATHAYPPFDRVAMDGIAISHSSWNAGQRRFFIEGCQKAGDSQKHISSASHCLEVMTGAILPKGTDVVIPYEEIRLENGQAMLSDNLSLHAMQNVHRKGTDCNVGTELLKCGEYLSSMHWPVIASEGRSTVHVSKRPTISIISTGSELVEVKHKITQEHQVYLSNPYGILASLRSLNFHDTKLNHFNDVVDEVLDGLKKSLSESDVLIISGGVSKGKYDFVPQVLGDLGVKCVFHRVAQKPGKPLWFGYGPSGQLVFGLPGNPVSVQICLHRYVIPALLKGIGVDMGQEDHQGAFAVLGHDIGFDKPLTYFPAVKIEYDRSGLMIARSIESNGSGDFISIRNSDGFLQLSPRNRPFLKGESFPLYEWKRRVPR